MVFQTYPRASNFTGQLHGNGLTSISVWKLPNTPPDDAPNVITTNPDDLRSAQLFRPRICI